jgi:small subunit ribosomal protein S8
VLQEKGFIKKFVVVEDGKQGILKILLRYTEGTPAIQAYNVLAVLVFVHYVDSAKLHVFVMVLVLLSSPLLKV